MKLVRVHNQFLEKNNGLMAERKRQYIKRVIDYYKNYATIPLRAYVNYEGARINIDSALLDNALIGAHYPRTSFGNCM